MDERFGKPFFPHFHEVLKLNSWQDEHMIDNNYFKQGMPPNRRHAANANWSENECQQMSPVYFIPPVFKEVKCWMSLVSPMPRNTIQHTYIAIYIIYIYTVYPRVNLNRCATKKHGFYRNIIYTWWIFHIYVM